MEEVNELNSPVAGIYKHFKGMQYEVLDIALCSETQEKHVVYRALYGDRALWIRPVEMFLERVERGNYTGPRFSPVS